MKKYLLVIVILFFFMGCNLNPNKEERLQKLETELELTKDKVNGLEKRVETLEGINKELELRIHEFEKP